MEKVYRTHAGNFQFVKDGVVTTVFISDDVITGISIGFDYLLASEESLGTVAGHSPKLKVNGKSTTLSFKTGEILDKNNPKRGVYYNEVQRCLAIFFEDDQKEGLVCLDNGFAYEGNTKYMTNDMVKLNVTPEKAVSKLVRAGNIPRNIVGSFEDEKVSYTASH